MENSDAVLFKLCSEYCRSSSDLTKSWVSQENKIVLTECIKVKICAEV
jgi:hypothetical protein